MATYVQLSERMFVSWPSALNLTPIEASHVSPDGL